MHPLHKRPPGGVDKNGRSSPAACRTNQTHAHSLEWVVPRACQSLGDERSTSTPNTRRTVPWTRRVQGTDHTELWLSLVYSVGVGMLEALG